ncbi:ATP-binding cassette domain-containing protein [bacterium]|nr:ATP-binding cassette domain-containing protein [bacterium]
MSRTAPIAALRDVRLSLGGAPLFSGVDLALSRGERISLVGRNGAGKSTLMRILAGAIEADSGEVFLQPGVRSRHLTQEPGFDGFTTAIDFVSAGLPEADLWRADAELDDWGVDRSQSLEALSGGQARRIALARAFAETPDILMLDEPTNHLDIDAIEQLEQRLLQFRGAALIVSHDRRFLETVSTSVAWLRQGRMHSLNRGYTEFEAWAETVETAEEKALDRLETQLKAEERWMARGVTARRRRNMGRVRKLADMRAERRERRTLIAEGRASASLEADAGAPSSRLVIEAKGVAKSYDPASPLVTDVSIRIMRGDRIGVIGANGAGKSTLLRVLLGEIEPDAGVIRRAATLQIAYLDQSRASLPEDATLWEALAPLGGDQVMVRGEPRHVASYAKDFLFDARQLRQPVSALSGGERNRLTLAIALARHSNLLVLDEPTNDLDIETLDLLEDMLADYAGTLIVVSHDRAFIDGVATSVLSPIGGGRWLETPGGYSDYLLQRPRQSSARPPGAATPPRQPAPPAKAPQTPERTRGKLSFKDARRLEDAEKRIPRLEAEIADIETALADPGLFTRAPDRFSGLAARLEAARAELEQAETDWLDLAERRDALENG